MLSKLPKDHTRAGLNLSVSEATTIWINARASIAWVMIHLPVNDEVERDNVVYYADSLTLLD